MCIPKLVRGSVSVSDATRELLSSYIDPYCLETLKPAAVPLKVQFARKAHSPELEALHVAYRMVWDILIESKAERGGCLARFGYDEDTDCVGLYLFIPGSYDRGMSEPSDTWYLLATE